MNNINPNPERTESQKKKIMQWFLEHPEVRVTWKDIYRLCGCTKAATRIGELINNIGFPINRDNMVSVPTMSGNSAKVREYYISKTDAERWKSEH